MTAFLVARELVNLQERSVMRTVASRNKFSRDLCEALQFWSTEEVRTFVEEMRGLNFSKGSDREVFLQFLAHWLHLEDAR